MELQVAKKRVKRDFLSKSEQQIYSLQEQLKIEKRASLSHYNARQETIHSRQHAVFNNFGGDRKIYVEHNPNNIFSPSRLKVQHQESRHQNHQDIQFSNYGNVAAQTDYSNGGYESDIDQLNWNGILGDRNTGSHMLFYNRQKYEVPNDQYYLDQWYLVSNFIKIKK